MEPASSWTSTPPRTTTCWMGTLPPQVGSTGNYFPALSLVRTWTSWASLHESPDPPFLELSVSFPIVAILRLSVGLWLWVITLLMLVCASVLCHDTLIFIIIINCSLCQTLEKLSLKPSTQHHCPASIFTIEDKELSQLSYLVFTF